MDLPRSLVASGAAPGLGIDLPHASARYMADYELLALARGEMPFTSRFGFETWESGEFALDTIGKFATLTHSHATSFDRCVGMRADDGSWFVAATFEEGWWSFTVAATSAEALDKFAAAMADLAGDPKPLSPNSVSMTIWSEHPMGGGQARYGSMSVGVWAEVMDNYPAATRARLEALATSMPPREAGGLIVFAGHAGTGKTRAIEALCHAWAGDARLGVVVDADRMLSSASYLTDVITAAGPDRRQVIVAEDADDKIRMGAKSDETSKLLNIADGIVGRLAGAGTLFVLSANEPLANIAPYILRPGRAAAVIDFERFSAAEGSAWLEARGADPAQLADDAEVSLAELYALL